MYKHEPIAKKFYDGLDEGKFLGLKCSDCGHIEFPPYPACNSCGHVGNEWIDLGGTEVTVHEIYSVSPMMTIEDFMPFAPLYTAECTFENGPEFVCMCFGITRQNYKEMRDSVPHKASFVVVPMDGYNTFAVSVDGAVPIRKETKSVVMNQQKLINTLGYKKAEKTSDNGIDGTYKLDAKMMGRSQKGKLNIVADGDELKGAIEIMDTVAEIQDGKLNGSNFEFSIEARGAELKMSGTIEKGKLSGTAKFGAMKMKLEGERE